jgi:capsular polysaccharide biosynthesis protein
MAHMNPLDAGQPESGYVAFGPMPSRAASPSNAKPAGDDAGSSITAGFVLHAIRQHLVISSVLGVLFAGLGGAAVWFTFKPMYTASTSLRMVNHQPYIVFPTTENSRHFVTTQVELLRSPFVLRRTLELPEISNLPEIRAIAGSEDPVQWLRKQLVARPVGESELVDVSFTGPNAENTALIVNTIISVYIDAQSKEFSQQRQTFLDILVEERNVRERTIEELRNTLGELTKEAGSGGAIAGESPGQVVVDRYSLLSAHEQRLTDAQVELEVLKAQVAAQREQSTKAVQIPQSQIDQIVAGNGEVAQFRARIATVRENMAAAAQGSEARARGEKEIADLEARIEQRLQEARSNAAEQLRGAVVAQQIQ